MSRKKGRVKEYKSILSKKNRVRDVFKKKKKEKTEAQKKGLTPKAINNFRVRIISEKQFTVSRSRQGRRGNGNPNIK